PRSQASQKAIRRQPVRVSVPIWAERNRRTADRSANVSIQVNALHTACHDMPPPTRAAWNCRTYSTPSRHGAQTAPKTATEQAPAKAAARRGEPGPAPARMAPRKEETGPAPARAAGPSGETGPAPGRDTDERSEDQLGTRQA